MPTRFATIQQKPGVMGVVRTPALIITDAHLQAPPRALSELSSELRGLVELAADARRRLEQLEPLYKRITDGTASAAERTRYRHLVAASTELIGTTQARLLLDRRKKPRAPVPVAPEEPIR